MSKQHDPWLMRVIRSIASSGRRAIAEREDLERRFELTFDYAAVGIVHSSLERRILLANRKFLDMTGYTLEELKRLPPAGLGDPKDVANDADLEQQLLAGKIDTYLSEQRYISKHGKVIWTKRTTSVARAADGTPQYYIRVVEDLTETKLNEERYRAMFENAAVGITRVDLDGVLVDVNQKFCDLLGYARAELIGKAILDITHPDDYSQGAVSRGRITQGAMKEAIGEKRFMRKDGAIIWARRTMSVARDYAGNPQYVISVVEDITERKKLEQQFQATFDQAAVGIAHFDLQHRNIKANRRYGEIVGYAPEELLGKPPGFLNHPDDIGKGGDQRNQLLTGAIDDFSQDKRYLRKDGSVVWVRRTESLARDDAGAPQYYIRVIEDVTERKEAEERQAMEHAVTRVLAESATLDEAMSAILQTICEGLGWACGAHWQWEENAELLRCVKVWHVDSVEVATFSTASQQDTNEAPRWDGGASKTKTGGLVRGVWFSGAPVWVPDVAQQQGFRRGPAAAKASLHCAFAFPILAGGQPLGVMEFYGRDIKKPDEALLQIVQAIGSQVGQFIVRQQAEERVRHLAHYDELTGLPNRSMFNERLSHALAHARRRTERSLAVLFIDLDRFKNINDTLGHEAGDRVLREVADRLRGSLRESDTVGRLGGDEFVVLIEEPPRPVNAAVVAQKILAAMGTPFSVQAQEFHLTASIGISSYPDDGADMQTLMKNADIAMYRAKEQGKNNFQFYAAHINLHSIERLTLESSLRRALERDEFLLHYQPKLSLDSGRITGVEALVRWQQPAQGLIPPAQFIQLAEETGLIVPIGEWVLRTACAQNKAWQQRGWAPVRVSVNLSPRQFAHENLLEDVGRVLKETGLDPAFLELEITESMVMHNPEQAVKLLNKLKALGIHLSIDDFGTGYSSLNYLKRFPLDTLKIDRTFIKDLPGDSDDAAITRAIIAMAHSLRLSVVAEGVETAAQLSFLRTHNCDEIQGYYFSKPHPESAIAPLLRDNVADGKVRSLG